MAVLLRAFEASDLKAMMELWNEVVREGNAFPQEEELTLAKAEEFFKAQTYSAVAIEANSNELLGLYILHPNNVGRCGHICNASYAVRSTARGQHIGELLVRDCLSQANLHGFKVLQFNAVVATNARARRLYEKLGFIQLGVIPGGFKLKDGSYEDICPYYHLV